MTPPPCVLDKSMSKHMCQTFVAKLRNTEAANAKVKEALVTEGVFPSAYDVVKVPGAQEMGTYLVITTSKRCDFDSYRTKLRKATLDKVQETDSSGCVSSAYIFIASLAGGMLPPQWMSNAPSSTKRQRTRTMQN